MTMCSFNKIKFILPANVPLGQWITVKIVTSGTESNFKNLFVNR